MAKWRDKPQAEKKADINRYKSAKKALDNYGRRERARGGREETATYRQLNAAVLEAEKEIPSRWR